MSNENPYASLIRNLTELRLPAIRQRFEEFARRAQIENLSYEQYLVELVKSMSRF